MRNAIGRVLITLGVLALLAALGLTSWNVWQDHHAHRTGQRVLQALHIPDSPAAELDLSVLEGMELPKQTVEGKEYVGRIEIPTLQVSLPVLNEWNDSNLKLAPCRYAGSVYQNNMVIAAHNYNSHFGKISSLCPADLVVFTDLSGNRFTYRVEQIKLLPATATAEMTDGTYPLVLFTCNFSGSERIAVCCVPTNA